jgi:hypothetical protein
MCLTKAIKRLDKVGMGGFRDIDQKERGERTVEHSSLIQPPRLLVRRRVKWATRGHVQRRVDWTNPRETRGQDMSPILVSHYGELSAAEMR